MTPLFTLMRNACGRRLKLIRGLGETTFLMRSRPRTVTRRLRSLHGQSTPPPLQRGRPYARSLFELQLVLQTVWRPRHRLETLRVEERRINGPQVEYVPSDRPDTTLVIGEPRMGRMDRAALGGLELEYEIRGAGEPVVLVHHGAGADWFNPLLEEPVLSGAATVCFGIIGRGTRAAVDWRNRSHSRTKRRSFAR